jgi:hypothetical protein
LLKEKQIKMTDVKQDVAPSATEEVPSTTEGQIQESQESDEVKGLRAAKEAEVQKRRDAEQRAMFAEQMLQTMQIQTNAPSEVAPREDYDPYDYATNETVEKTVEKKVNEALKQSQTSMAQQNYQMVRNKYDDFDQVVGPGSYFDKIQKETPGLLKKIEELPNAAEIAYRIGSSHQDYQKQKIEKATSEIANQIDANSKKTPTLSGVGGTDPSTDEIDKYAKMSDEEIDAEIRRVKGTQ